MATSTCKFAWPVCLYIVYSTAIIVGQVLYFSDIVPQLYSKVIVKLP